MNDKSATIVTLTRRQILASGAAIATVGVGAKLRGFDSSQTTSGVSIARDQAKDNGTVSQARPSSTRGTMIVGALSGREIFIPDVNSPPAAQFAQLAADTSANGPDDIGTAHLMPSYPDVLSFKRKFGVLIPSANTIVEPELWSLILKNQRPEALDGVGIHISNISTPKPQLKTAQDLQMFKEQIVVGLKTSIAQALSAQPQYLMMGMSLEHILSDIAEIRTLMANIESDSGLSCSTWHDAALAALKKFGAKRIGMVTPFDSNGNANAKKVFEALGFEVVAQYGFSCANAVEIAHVPNWAKERAIMHMVNDKPKQLDAIVQCGTNMSMNKVIERIEPVAGIPILGINSTLLWHALRENGFVGPLTGGGRLLREF